MLGNSVTPDRAATLAFLTGDATGSLALAAFFVLAHQPKKRSI